MSSKVLVPEVQWAQRSNESDADKNYLLLTISIPDCEDPKLTIEPTFFDLKAKSKGHVGDEVEHEYNLHIDFFKEIIPDKTLHKKANGQHYFLKIYKKDLQAEYWPRLTKEKIKYRNIKTDFDKWVDEDEQDEQPKEDDNDLSALAGAGGMPGMGGAGGMPGMGGAGGMDFASMLGGGAGGAGGMSPEQAQQLQELMKQMQQQEGAEGHDHDHDHDHEHENDDDDEEEIEEVGSKTA